MSSSLTVATFVIVTCLTSGILTENESKQVYFSLILSNGENGFNSSGVVPAVDIALKAIEDKQLLPGYNLTYAPPRNSKVGL